MDQINTTQLVGLVSFAGSAVLCGMAWRVTKDRPRTWGWLAVVHAVMALEVALMNRHQASGALRDLLRSADLYQDRSDFQSVVVLLGMIFAVVAMFWVLMFRFRASATTRLAVCATFFAVLAFAVETLSLHSLDAIFYRKTGPVLLIGWVWVALAVATSSMALMVYWRAFAPDH